MLFGKPVARWIERKPAVRAYDIWDRLLGSLVYAVIASTLAAAIFALFGLLGEYAPLRFMAIFFAIQIVGSLLFKSLWQTYGAAASILLGRGRPA